MEKMIKRALGAAVLCMTASTVGAVTMAYEITVTWSHPERGDVGTTKGFFAFDSSIAPDKGVSVYGAPLLAFSLAIPGRAQPVTATVMDQGNFLRDGTLWSATIGSDCERTASNSLNCALGTNEFDWLFEYYKDASYSSWAMAHTRDCIGLSSCETFTGRVLVSPVPEPTTWALFALGGAVLAARGRKRDSRTSAA